MIKPTKITITGKFWDIFLYENNLYLFMIENKEIKIIDWCKFITNYITDENLELAFRCAFWNSDYLYDVAQKGIFDDKEFKEVLVNKFEKINDIKLELQDLSLFDKNKIKSYYPKYFADLDVYNNKMYLGCESGLYFSEIRRKVLKRKPALSFQYLRQTNKLNICAIKFSNSGNLAISTQDQGLFEFNTFIAEQLNNGNDEFGSTQLSKISNEHSSYVGINYSSILSASYIKSPVFIQRDYKTELDDKKTRYDKQIYDLAEIFNDKEKKGFYFSFKEKVYQIINGNISYCCFAQSKNTKEDVFHNITNIGSIGQLENNEIVCASVESFGVIIECKTKIVVLLSDNTFHEYCNEENNEIISFRTYPRSNCYTNQLHIIYSNKIEIISFNQDYFENQDTKKYGIKFVNTNKKNKYSF